MSTPYLLPSDEHARVFKAKVVPESGLQQAASHSTPRAVLLAGQPGAGKGGLAKAALLEMSGDLVAVDPDELRKNHPSIQTLHQQHPYTWPKHTHPDASQWADELLDAVIDGRKNLIYDTTLANDEWGVKVVKRLQAAGYDVEVRAVAAHRLESELGVNERFADSLDRKGHGRYVPAEARDASYAKLPRSLDTIHAETGVRVRLFDREGAELYDSRTDPRPPGAALEQVREARTQAPRLTRQLRDGWREHRRRFVALTCYPLHHHQGVGNGFRE